MSGEPPLQRGDRGDWVIYLQMCLTNAGIPVDSTGEFDDATAAAVGAYRSSRGLDSTEQADEPLWYALEAEGALG